MTNKLEGFDESAIEVFQIAEAYAKENMNAAIEPAHILKALLHKDIGLVSFIEKTLNADYYYILEWADIAKNGWGYLELTDNFRRKAMLDV